MCYGSAARPPLPPIAGAGGRAAGRDVVLTAEDGNRFNASTALAAGRTSGGPGMVILPDVRGLHKFYRDLALRFAEASIHATAFDYFGRTAGTEPRAQDFDFMAHVRQTTPNTIALDA